MNILQSHGFPKVMGVLTHLDKFRNNKTLKTTKKRLKNRFWTEIYQGAKLFYLSGIINGKYPNMEIQNLARFISVMKFRPLLWRNTHPYVVADRIEDLTDPELVHRQPNCDRTVTLYGYLRGTNLKPNMRVHIPGAGDHYLADVSVLPDPCPLPDKVRKKLDEKNKLIYAPMSDVGGVMYDKDAVYINVPGHFTKKSAYAPADLQGEGEAMELDQTKEEEVIPHGTGEKLVMNLQDATDTLASQLAESELRIFSNSSPVKASDVTEALEEDDSGRTRRRAVFGTEQDDEDEDDEDDDEEDDNLMDEGDDDDEEEDENAPRRGNALSKFDTRNIPKKGEKEDALDDDEPQFEFADSDSDLGEEDEEEDMVLVDGRQKRSVDDEANLGELRWKANLKEKASEMFASQKRTNLMSLIYNQPDLSPEDIVAGNYGDDLEDEEEEADDEDEFFKLNRETVKDTNIVDSSRDPIDFEELEEWDEEETLDSIRNRFITGDADAANGESAFAPEEEEEEGEFEDLEADEEEEGKEGETKSNKRDKDAMIRDPQMVEREKMAKRKEEIRKKYFEEFGDDEDTPKMDFYEQKKSEIEQQLQTNREEFENDDPHTRAMVEGYRPGSYVRLLIKDMPCEFVENFDPTYPVLVGGLLATEDQFGWVQVRIKRHRWHPRILKTNDPLIFSMGWRRFQSIPIYSLNDGTRNRMLKYSPEHMHCLATFYGPVHTPNTGFCAVQNVADSRAVSICITSFFLINY